MRINNNISALRAFNQVNFTANKLQDTIQQVTTGLRINSAADDAAGLAISENMRAQTRGLEQSIRNTQDGISLLQTAEGALNETNSMLQRMRELSVQAANDTLTSQDRSYIQMEIDDLKEQIDRIANTTHFNNNRILNGNCCGTCSSTDTTTKGYIRGAIKAEGNYRLDIKADPGAAQVQKSSIFKIKHENVATNKQLNSENGIGNLKIDSLPAGNYAITATKAGGGEITYSYTQEAQVTVTNGNTSGVTESLKFDLKFKNQSGSPTSISVDVGDIASGEDIISRIKESLNGQTKSITIGDDTADFEFEVDDNGKITSTTKQDAISLSNITFSPTGGKATTKLTNIAHKSDDASTHTIKGMWSISDNTEEGPIKIAITDGGYTGTCKLEFTAGNMLSAIENLNEQVTLENTDGESKQVTLTGATVGSSNFNLTISAKGEYKSGSIVPTASGFDLTQVGDLAQGTTYSYISTGTGSVTSGNTSTSEENIYIYVRTGSESGSDVASYTVKVDPKGEDVSDDAYKASIAQSIANAVNGKKIEYTYNGKSDSAVLTGKSDGKNFTLQASNSQTKLYFKISTNKTPSMSIPEQTFSNPESEIDSISSGAVTSLTGFYGNSDAADSISAKVDSNTQNNASILFEVTSTSQDSNGNSIITLSANSHVLSTDGENSNLSKNNIIISTGSNTVNLGALLGEDDANLTLTLDPSKFESGNKFVLNVSGNGTTANPADTSLYVKGSLDSSWPLSWSDDYITYKNNELYYNVNSAAVSNRELRFRNFYLNPENGKVHDGEINLTVNKDFAAAAALFPDPPAEGESKTSEITLGSFTANYIGKIADGTTKLRDLEQFWDKSGVFMLERPQVINITQNDGKKASITLNASDTLNDVRQKLNKAIAEDLGQEKYISGTHANNLVTFVETPTEGSGMETVKGTFLIRSVIPGSAGELTFSSIEGDLIDALGLNTVQSSQEGSYNVSVYNAHNGEAIARNIKTSENMLCGIIDENIDVEFDAMSGVNAIWSDKDKNFILVPDSDYYSTVLHVVKNNINFQVGANEGEDITIDIGDMSSAGLRINGVNVMTRERASKAITTLDKAIKSVSAQRAKIGSYENALESTMENLTITSANLTSSESRIRDADISKSMMDLVKFQIIHQSSTSMLAQANQTPQSVLNLLQ